MTSVIGERVIDHATYSSLSKLVSNASLPSILSGTARLSSSSRASFGTCSHSTARVPPQSAWADAVPLTVVTPRTIASTKTAVCMSRFPFQEVCMSRFPFQEVCMSRLHFQDSNKRGLTATSRITVS